MSDVLWELIVLHRTEDKRIRFYFLTDKDINMGQAWFEIYNIIRREPFYLNDMHKYECVAKFNPEIVGKSIDDIPKELREKMIKIGDKQSEDLSTTMDPIDWSPPEFEGPIQGFNAHPDWATARYDVYDNSVTNNYLGWDVAHIRNEIALHENTVLGRANNP